MRFIDLESLSLSSPGLQDVLDRLNQARAEVIAEPDPEKRKKLFQKYSTRWTAMREYLATLSYGKCWYVECRDSGALNDVDHFRPKSRVAEDDNHPGYYWLAFDWTNFRLSCQRSNRPGKNKEIDEVGGKADYFELTNPASRAYDPEDNLTLEEPMLLDPTNPADPPLITFDPDGTPRLAPRYSGSEKSALRFEYSRRKLNIDMTQFNEDRLGLFNEIQRLVNRGRREMGNRDIGSQASESLINTIRDLKRMMKPSAPYSSAAAAYIRLFKSDLWIEQMVLNEPA